MPTPTEWLNESQANTGTAATGNQSKPQIIGLSNGNILVAWQDDAAGIIGSTGDQDIIGKIFGPDGTVVVDSFRLNASRTADNEREFSIAATNDGGFIIAYVDNDISSPNNADLVFERKNASGSQTAFGTIASETSATTSLVAPSVAVNLTDNSFLVTWTTIENGNDNVRGRHFSATNVGGTEFAAGQSGTDDDLDSATAILTNGNFVTVYDEVDTGVTGVEFKINTSAGVFVANSNISSGANIEPAVASLSNGNWVAVWTDTDTGNGDVLYQVFTATGGSVVGPSNAGSGADFQNEPIVVALPDGGFVIVWDNDTDGTLEAQAFTAAGVADGTVVVIAPTDVTRPSASATADGRVAFAWVSNASSEIFWSIWDPRGGQIDFANYDLNLPNVLETTVVRAGLGPNTITGTASDNTILGGPVNDTLIGEGGADSISGLDGDDTIFGSDGDDTLMGGAGTDSINGGNNDDTIIIKNGEFIDHVNGGAGTDTLDLSQIVSAGQAIDIDLEALKMTGLGGTVTVVSIEVIIGTALNDSIFADAGVDTIRGGLGNDTLGGGFAEDFVFGEGGDDRFVIRAGEFLDNVDGGADTDTLDVSALLAVEYSGATVDFALGLITTTFATDGSVTVASVEAYVDNAGSNTILDSSSNMTIVAGDGDDTVIESIYGGVDKFDLGGGTDMLVINNIGIGAGDVFDGGAGTDTIDYSNLTFSSANSVVIDLLDGEIREKSGNRETVFNFENVTGSQGNETIEGTNGANIINGREGSDSVLGHGGADVLEGGEGNDTLDGGADRDTASYAEKLANVAITLAGSAQASVFVGGVLEDSVANIENILGGSGNDTLVGDGQDNLFRGGVGIDAMNGGAGSDTADYSDKVVGVITALNAATAVTVFVGGVAEDRIAAIENLVGGSANDSFTGDASVNVFEGGDGNDTLAGALNNDTLDGGAGSDTASFAEKATAVVVTLNGAVQVSVLIGGVFEDSIRNIENLVGGSAGDTFIGDGLNNAFRGGAGIDAMNGGGGTDTADYADKVVAVVITLNGATAATVFVGGVGEDRIAAIENLIGGSAGDTFTGDTLANVFEGGAGNDTLTGLLGNDTLDGGADSDTASYAEKAAAVVVTLNGAVSAAVRVGGVLEDSIRNIENLIGGSAGDTFVGDGLNNTFRGGAGIDAMNGGAGTDTADFSDKVAPVITTLNGATAVTVFVGGVGEDRIAAIENLLGGSAGDVLTGDAQANVFEGLGGNDTLTGALGNDTLDGGAGMDTASYAEKSAAVVITLNGAVSAAASVGGVLEDSIRNIENLVGGTAGDAFTGDVLANVFEGGAGNDTLTGLLGNDTLDGGADSDTASYAEKAAVVVITLNGVVSAVVRVGGVVEDSIRNIENLIGGTAGDTFVGDGLDNTFLGGAGIDAMNGGAGTDTADFSDKAVAVVTALNGTTAVTVFVGGVGEDRIAAIENLVGGSAGDTLTGDALVNRLEGGGGNDTLNGALGNDTLTGGLGNDHFVFSTAVGAGNIDTITDFQLTLDKLVLDDDIFTALGIVGTAPGVALTASLFQLGAAANDAGDRIVYNQATGQLFYDTDGNGAAAQQQIALIGVSTHAALTAGDFLVVA